MTGGGFLHNPNSHCLPVIYTLSIKFLLYFIEKVVTKAKIYDTIVPVNPSQDGPLAQLVRASAS